MTTPPPVACTTVIGTPKGTVLSTAPAIDAPPRVMLPPTDSRSWTVGETMLKNNVLAELRTTGPVVSVPTKGAAEALPGSILPPAAWALTPLTVPLPPKVPPVSETPPTEPSTCSSPASTVETPVYPGLADWMTRTPEPFFVRLLV